MSILTKMEICQWVYEHPSQFKGINLDALRCSEIVYLYNLFWAFWPEPMPKEYKVVKGV